jgi:hypothetical protein
MVDFCNKWDQILEFHNSSFLDQQDNSAVFIVVGPGRSHGKVFCMQTAPSLVTLPEISSSAIAV